MKAADMFSENLLEMQHSSSNQHKLWNNLSISQNLEAKNLHKAGYELTFLCKDSADMMAIMLNGENIVTVNDHGDINKSSEFMIEEIDLTDTHLFCN